jgi:hypothetical protein
MLLDEIIFNNSNPLGKAQNKKVVMNKMGTTADAALFCLNV